MPPLLVNWNRTTGFPSGSVPTSFCVAVDPETGIAAPPPLASAPPPPRPFRPLPAVLSESVAESAASGSAESGRQPLTTIESARSRER